MTERTNEHLTELEIYELGTDGTVTERAESHAESCAACAAEVAGTRRMLAAVEGLDAPASAPATLEPRLARRLAEAGPGSGVRHSGRRSASPGPWVRAAAAVLLFLAGAGAHAAWVGVVDSDSASAKVPPVLAVQHAGTEYVAAIAGLVADSSRLTELERRHGRDVGLAAMVGAAYELRLLWPGDAATEELHRLSESAWTEEADR